MRDSSFFDRKYVEDGYVWGKEPSEIAKIAAENLRGSACLSILDVGCGYGRDILYLSKILDCEITGVDTSQNGLAMAKDLLIECSSVELLEKDFLHVTGSYDVIIVSHVYHLLRPAERAPFIYQMKNLLSDNGQFFLSAHSISDKQEYGKGEPVVGESNSFIRETYSHFFTKDELERDFTLFDLKLYEHSFLEKRVGGDHHHTSWIVIGRKKQL